MFLYETATVFLHNRPREVGALGKRSYEIWSKHPSFRAIEQQTVEEKTKLVTEKINELMGISVF